MRVETPNSFRECPSVTFTCLYLLTFANTSQSRETESASPNPSPGRNFDSPTLPSPLLLRNYHGGSFINYTHIHTTLKTVTATKNRQGYVLVALPSQVATDRALPKHSRPVQKWFCSGGINIQNRVDSGR